MAKTVNQEIADLLFPQVTKTLDDLEQEYPERDLPHDARVTRIAPSPTGFVHIGVIYAALIPERLAHQSHGVFILRVEDTDKKREMEGGVDELAHALAIFHIETDEGMKSATQQIGAYGPYLQSQRIELYTVAAKHLVAMGLAYPSFVTPEEVAHIREQQNEQKVKPGYYGTWAADRDLTIDAIKKNIKAGKKFAIRVRADGKEGEKVTHQDLIKGSVTFPKNDQDYVILKSDGLPTYHLGHVVDDHFMRVTDAIRGVEWLASTPLHLQLFRYFDWTMPLIGHFSSILKIDGTSKRKLSKRKDPEASVSFYLKEGIPVPSVIEYLLTIANSNYEDWRRTHEYTDNKDFILSTKKINPAGALFDLAKLEDISKQVIGKMTQEEIYEQACTWAQTYNTALYENMHKQKEYTIKIFGIERDAKAKRKDIYKWGQLPEYIGYFYDEIYTLNTAMLTKVTPEDQKEIISLYLNEADSSKPKEEWFATFRSIAQKVGYASDAKSFKEHPDQYKGDVGMVAMVIRVALTGKTMTPDLYEIIHVMGENRVKHRLEQFQQAL